MKKASKNRSHIFKIYQIIGIILLCAILLFGSYKITLAWFVDQSVTSNGQPNILVVGTVDLNVKTNFNYYNLVLAPDTIYTENVEDGKTVSYATKLSTGIKNDIGNIYVRAKFSTNRPELSLYFTNLTTDTEYTASANGKWVYNDSDDFYYYIGSVGTSEITFNAGYYVDNTLDNSDAGDDVEIDFVFESIQRPYGAYHAVWTTAPAIFDSFASADSGYVEPQPEPDNS